MSQLSITVDTADSRVVREVSEMLLRLSGQAELPLLTTPTYAQISVGSLESSHSNGIEQEENDEESYEVPTTCEVDSAGTPWDARIHSSSKGTVANGTWKKRKNLPDGLYESVMAEIMGNGHMSATPTSEPTATQQAVPTTDSTPPPPPPPPPPPAPSAGSSAPATFAELMQRITANKIPLQKLQAWCTEQGLGSFSLLGQHPDRLGDAAAHLGV